MGPPGRPVPPPKAPKVKRFTTLAAVLFAVGGLLVGCMAGNAAAGGSKATAGATVTATATVTEKAGGAPAAGATVTVPGPTVTVTQPAAPPKETKPAAPVIGDGSWLVGTDIAIGSWRTKEAVSGGLCYADTQDKAGNILEQEVTPSGKTIIQIKKGAYKFTSRGCGEWEKVG